MHVMNINERFNGVTAICLADGFHAVELLTRIQVDGMNWFTCRENLAGSDGPNWFELSGPMESILAVRRKI